MSTTSETIEYYLKKLESAKSRNDSKHLYLIGLEILNNLISNESEHLLDKKVLDNDKAIKDTEDNKNKV